MDLSEKFDSKMTSIIVIIFLFNVLILMFPLASATPPEAVAGPDISTKQGLLVTLNGSASNDDVGLIAWTWTFKDDGLLVSLDGMIVTYIFNNIGTINVTLTVLDGDRLNDTDELIVTVVDGISPTANAGPDITVEQGTRVTFDGQLSTDNVGIINYTWDFGNGMIGYGPLVYNSFAIIATYDVTLNVSDAEGNWATDVMVLTVIKANIPPEIVHIPNQEVPAEVPFTYDVEASDVDGDTLAYSLLTHPVGMAINKDTGEIAYTFPGDDVGRTFQIEVQVSDNRTNVTSTFSIKVKPIIPTYIIIEIGPVLETNGLPVEGADVHISLGDEVVYVNETRANGRANLKVPVSWTGNDIIVKITKDGYKETDILGEIDDDGVVVLDNPPVMTKKEHDAPVPNYGFLGAAIIALAVLAGVLLFMERPKEDQRYVPEEDETIPQEEE